MRCGRHTLIIVGYSTGVDARLSLSELQPHLYSLPHQPDAILLGYLLLQASVGFCLSHRERESLPEGTYRARIDAAYVAGSLDYGQFVLPGRSAYEILFSSYCCHPAMANNELSGPVLAVALAQWLAVRPEGRYTYRFLFVPEMIGSAAMLETHRARLAEHVRAAFNLTCVGDERAWSFLPSRLGGHLRRSHGPARAAARRGALRRLCLARPGQRREHVLRPRHRHSDGVDHALEVQHLSRVPHLARHTAPGGYRLGLAESLCIHRTLVDVIENDCMPRSLVLA